MGDKRASKWLDWVLWILTATSLAYMVDQRWNDGTLTRHVRGESVPAQRTGIAIPFETGESNSPVGRAFRLTEAPRIHYGEVLWTEQDNYFASLTEDLEQGEYDPALGHAAREVAAFYSDFGALPYSGALMFILNAAGAADWGVKQVVFTSRSMNEEDLLERVQGLLRQEDTSARPARFGIGEVLSLSRRGQRVFSILVSRSDLYLDPTPRQILPGLHATVRGTLPRGAHSARALRMGPDGLVESVPVVVDGERFEIRFPAGTHRGMVWLELIATLAHGPTPLAQLGFTVDAPLESVWRAPALPDESDINSEQEAGAFAMDLLAGDRARFNLHSLETSPELRKIASTHCEEMAREGFFGHQSPTTGSVRDRAVTAGISFQRIGENLARNSSLAGAQEGLMFSLGHRASCLSEDFTHVGIAAHSIRNNEAWLVCQVFATLTD